MKINFLGIKISRKTDILAFTAFLLSLSSFSYQIFIFLRGPKVILTKPRHITAYMHPATGTKKTYLTLISTFAYINNAPQEYNAVIEQEYILFSIGDKKYKYTWHQFGLTKNIPKTDKIEFIESQTAAPFIVPGKGAIAHETLFAPRYDLKDKKEFIDSEDIEKAFEDALKGKDMIWKFQFYSETQKGLTKNTIKECEVTVTYLKIHQLLSNNSQWTELKCNTKNYHNK